ncbi:aminopeptidase [Alkaliphilus peptidifermentans]|uniref:Aminopeptidase n=1 Tax=Alkaliphilus peptidifermentans DSM 18978 TaxID=1120976 RepID=A0A1G5FHG1_9FIRM|nr:aminopeptidase [Alkaliphilus peptidifermentans]SCY38653.1 aminopeptidase [Alkaliphilus peptidifermentans DSM 18978]
MESFEVKLEKYADLALKVGINLQKNQTLVINAPIDSAVFVRQVAKKAYFYGAKNVHIEWHDEETTLIKYQHAPDEAFKEYPLWKAKGFEEMAADGAAFLSISATNPDLLKDVDPERIAVANKTSALALQEFKKYTQTAKVSWAIVSVPTKEWAAKVFPNSDVDRQVDLLWEKIFMVTRIDQENPIDAWKIHINNLKARLTYLNDTKFRRLHFKAPGSNLTAELPDSHLWIGGGIKNAQGIDFVPNMPTEEVFTLPLKTGVNGTVKSTKPLNYGGKLIEDFSLTFEKGRIVDYSATVGYESLKKLIETDEGAHYLGEIALVPHHSPVSNSNVVFYNTLFDENASVHLALGMAYPLCIKNGGQMSKEELEENGANTSLIHIDFMIGSEEMDIDGETSDGKIIPVFRKGNWAI